MRTLNRCRWLSVEVVWLQGVVGDYWVCDYVEVVWLQGVVGDYWVCDYVEAVWLQGVVGDYVSSEAPMIPALVVWFISATSVCVYLLTPRAGSGVVRIDPLHFLAGCRTRRLNQV